MKTAFVHDWIVHEGGAEAVLKDLIQTTQYNEAKLFVLYSTQKEFLVNTIQNPDGEQQDTTISIPIVTALPGWINHLFVFLSQHHIPVLSKLFDYRNLMFWFPLLCRILRHKIYQFQPDHIVIDSFAAVKNIIKPEKNRHQPSQDKKTHTTLYLHSPMQYIRENYDENISKLGFPIKQLYQFATNYLRPWDTLERTYDVVLCNSNYTAELAKQLYNIDGQVSYPQIDKAFKEEPLIEYPKDYYIFVGRVQRYVREIDKVIHICNATHASLIVMGDGPDMDYARSIAGPTVLFVGKITQVDEKIALMKHARGMINLAKESFGIATSEALCLGVPVFGYNGGATPELVDSKNGCLVEHKDLTTLIENFQEFRETDFDRLTIAAHARKKFFS